MGEPEGAGAFLFCQRTESDAWRQHDQCPEGERISLDCQYLSASLGSGDGGQIDKRVRAGAEKKAQ